MEYKFRGVIPKRPKRAVLKFGVTWFDFFWVILAAIIAFVIAFSIPSFVKSQIIGFVIKILIGLLLTILPCTLLVPVNVGNIRLYNLIWWWMTFKFIDKNKYEKGSSLTPVRFNPYWKVNYEDYAKEAKNFLILGDEKENMFMGAIEFAGLSIFQLDDINKQLIIDLFHEIISMSELDIQIAKISVETNRDQNNRHLSDLILKTEEEFKKGNLLKEQFNSRKHILESYTDKYFTNLEEGNVNLQDKYYFVVYSSNTIDLNRELNRISQTLNSKGFASFRCDYAENVNLVQQTLAPLSNSVSRSIIEKNKDDLTELLAFDTLEFSADSFCANGNAYFKASTILDFPIAVGLSWIDSLFNVAGSVILNIKEFHGDLNKFLSKNMMNLTLSQEQMNQTKVVDIAAMDLEKEVYEIIINDLATGREKLKSFSAMIMVSGNSEADVLKQTIEIKKQLKLSGLVLYELKYKQQEAFEQFFLKPHTPLDGIIGRLVPSYTIALGYPFNSNSLDDEDGMYLGENLSLSQIIYNQWGRPKGLRANHNLMLIGTSGSGKSHLLKKIAIWNTVSFVNTDIIDIENEFAGLANYLGEQVIHIGYGKNVINPLQIMATPSEHDGNDAKADISNYLSFLENWFRLLYKEAKEFDLGWLVRQISELYYERKPIQKAISLGQRVSELGNEDYPIISDLIMLLEKRLMKQSPDLYSTNKYWINTLKQDFINGGKYEVMLNQKSTIKVGKSNLTVYDVKMVFDMRNSQLKEAILDLIFSFITNKINNTRIKNDILFKEKVIELEEQGWTNLDIIEKEAYNYLQKQNLIIDEGHKLLNEGEVCLNFVFGMVKMLRKYQAGLTFATQNVNDFVKEGADLKKAEAIITNTPARMVMLCDSGDIEGVEKLLKYDGGLTNEERNYVLNAGGGKGLFMTHKSNRHCIQVSLNSKEYDSIYNRKE